MRLRAFALTVVAVLAGAVAAGPASAAPSPVSISSIEVKSGKLIGLVGTHGGAAVDPGLTVTIGGKGYSVDAIASGAITVVTRRNAGPARLSALQPLTVAVYPPGVFSPDTR